MPVIVAVVAVTFRAGPAEIFGPPAGVKRSTLPLVTPHRVRRDNSREVVGTRFEPADELAGALVPSGALRSTVVFTRSSGFVPQAKWKVVGRPFVQRSACRFTDVDADMGSVVTALGTAARARC